MTVAAPQDDDSDPFDLDLRHADLLSPFLQNGNNGRRRLTMDLFADWLCAMTPPRDITSH